MTLKSIAVLVVIIFAGIWILNFLLFKPIKFVSLCQNTPFMVCEMAQAEFTRDSMEGVFLIEKIYPDRGNSITFTPLCVIPPAGGRCADPITGEAFDIIPTAFTLRAWRWDKTPYSERY